MLHRSVEKRHAMSKIATSGRRPGHIRTASWPSEASPTTWNPSRSRSAFNPDEQGRDRPARTTRIGISLFPTAETIWRWRESRCRRFTIWPVFPCFSSNSRSACNQSSHPVHERRRVRRRSGVRATPISSRVGWLSRLCSLLAGDFLSFGHDSLLGTGVFRKAESTEPPAGHLTPRRRNLREAPTSKVVAGSRSGLFHKSSRHAHLRDSEYQEGGVWCWGSVPQ